MMSHNLAIDNIILQIVKHTFSIWPRRDGWSVFRPFLFYFWNIHLALLYIMRLHLGFYSQINIH